MRHSLRMSDNIPIKLRLMPWLIKKEISNIENMWSKVIWNPPRMDNVISTRPR